MHGQFARGAATAVLMVAVTFGLAACGDDDDSSSSATSTPDTAEIAVPAAVKSKGTLTVAADATYAPSEFIDTDGKTVIGMDADLAKAIAAKFGLKAKVSNASFDGIILNLAAHKYDLGMSSFTDTKEREKTVNFVTYFSAGTSFFVAADGGPAIATLGDLCGHKVAVEKGTTQADDVAAQTKKCKTAGKTAVKELVFPDQNGANLALSSGRADVSMADSPVAAYQVKQSDGKFKLSGDSYGTAPYGIAIPKDSEMTEPVLAAVKAIMADGTYTKILDKWGVSAGAITDPAINAATS
jgi:polar amino acid transport system substrate-binding protein